jgi:hypothetical protein
VARAAVGAGEVGRAIISKQRVITLCGERERFWLVGVFCEFKM